MCMTLDADTTQSGPTPRSVPNTVTVTGEKFGESLTEHIDMLVLRALLANEVPKQ